MVWRTHFDVMWQTVDNIEKRGINLHDISSQVVRGSTFVTVDAPIIFIYGHVNEDSPRFASPTLWRRIMEEKGSADFSCWFTFVATCHPNHLSSFKYLGMIPTREKKRFMRRNKAGMWHHLASPIRRCRLWLLLANSVWRFQNPYGTASSCLAAFVNAPNEGDKNYENLLKILFIKFNHEIPTMRSTWSRSTYEAWGHAQKQNSSPAWHITAKPFSPLPALPPSPLLVPEFRWRAVQAHRCPNGHNLNNENFSICRSIFWFITGIWRCW